MNYSQLAPIKRRFEQLIAERPDAWLMWGALVQLADDSAAIAAIEFDKAEDEAERLRAAVSRVRELAEEWANRVPDDRGNVVVDTVVSSVGQQVLRALDGEQ